MRFSVVIPLYQKADVIKRSLEAALGQTYPSHEIIVVDDGSKDGGADVVSSIADPRIKLIRQPNAGVSVARNRGIAEASGEYIAFLDADDYWDKDHLETLHGLATMDPNAVILGTGWREGDQPNLDATLPSGEVISVTPSMFCKHAIRGMPPFWASAVAVRRDAIPTAGLFEPGSRMGEDQDGWLTMLQIGNGLRSKKVTASYDLEAPNRAMSEPNIKDFDSVIFHKWSKWLYGPDRDLSEFVAAHRLYTINRHRRHRPVPFLLGHLLRTPTKLQREKKLKMLVLILLRR